MDHFNQETYDREHLKEASALTILSIANELRDKRSTACARSFLQGWMFDTPIENISKQDLGEWISGMVFHKYVDELDYNQQIKVKSLIEEYESIIGMELNETGTTRKINLFLDSFQICFRPIIYYSVCYTLGLLAKYSFTTSHFDCEDLGDIIVYKRQGIDNQPALVLFHGFGIGLLPYVPFVDGLFERFPNRTIILFELKSLSMRMNLDFILPEQFASKAVGFLAKHQITEIFAIGHSFGTACICWLDQHSPNLVSSRLFIDPICFALWTPDIARNFIYRSVNKFRYYLMQFVVMMEPGTHLFLRRYFVWHKNTYFSDQLPRNCKVYLSEDDDIVNAKNVAEYLQNMSENGRSFEILKDHAHGGFLLRSEFNKFYDDIRFLEGAHA